MRALDVVYKTCQERWVICTDGEREKERKKERKKVSSEFELSEGLDDDDDDDQDHVCKITQVSVAEVALKCRSRESGK